MKRGTIKTTSTCVAISLVVGMGITLAEPVSVPTSDRPGGPMIKVYPVADVDAYRDKNNKAFVDRFLVVEQRVDKHQLRLDDLHNEMVASEQRLKDEVKASIDHLPQRLLSDEAKNVVKDAVVQELRGENAQLRQDIEDLRKQIDALKKSGGQ